MKEFQQNMMSEFDKVDECIAIDGKVINTEELCINQPRCSWQNQVLQINFKKMLLKLQYSTRDEIMFNIYLLISCFVIFKSKKKSVAKVSTSPKFLHLRLHNITIKNKLVK